MAAADTDPRTIRKSLHSMQGLAMLVQQVLAEDPFNGALYAFRGRRGERVTFYLPPVRYLADA